MTISSHNSMGLDFKGAVRRGSAGDRVRLVQEWLCLHGSNVVVDGIFGPATEGAVRSFQGKRNLDASGVVDRATFRMLVSPMMNILRPLKTRGKSLGAAVVSHARRHLKQHPCEVGGQNRGPWVRLYMNGADGNGWPWCAGFVCFILRQASTSLGVPMPFPPTFSCTTLAEAALEKGLFLPGFNVWDSADISRGALFLIRKGRKRWSHVGIVTKACDDFFHTIEGNTNDRGHREGYEVCERMRGYRSKDFVLLDP